MQRNGTHRRRVSMHYATLLLGALFAVAGCDGDDPECETGETQDCICTNGDEGSQGCDEGDWDDCVCPTLCTPDDTQPCICGENFVGEQTCSGDGSEWSDCSCETQCTPEEQRDCTCEGELDGTQQCNGEGTAWEDCECSTLCTPLEEADCTCDDGTAGTRTCSEDGASWGECHCPMVCVPDEERACSCEDGAEGMQACDEDGMGWDDCDCPDTCAPGEERGCACDDGMAGTHSCNEDGLTWGECDSCVDEPTWYPRTLTWIGDGAEDWFVIEPTSSATYTPTEIDIRRYGAAFLDADTCDEIAAWEVGSEACEGCELVPLIAAHADWLTGEECALFAMEFDEDVVVSAEHLATLEHSIRFSLLTQATPEDSDDWFAIPPEDWDFLQYADREYRLDLDAVFMDFAFTCKFVRDPGRRDWKTCASVAGRVVFDRNRIYFILNLTNFEHTDLAYRLVARGWSGAEEGIDVSGADPTVPLTPIPSP